MWSEYSSVMHRSGPNALFEYHSLPSRRGVLSHRKASVLYLLVTNEASSMTSAKELFSCFPIKFWSIFLCFFFCLAGYTILMMWRRVESVELQGLGRTRIDDIMLCTRRNDDTTSVWKCIFVAIYHCLSRATVDTEKLIYPVVCFESDVVSGSDTHEDKLGMMSGIDDMAKGGICLRHLFEISVKSFHMKKVKDKKNSFLIDVLSRV